MSRLFYHVMQDNLGNLLFGVTGTVRLSGTGTLATIYGDEGLTIILPNPTMNHPSFGSFKFFLPSGDFDFYMAKAGYTFETLTGVQGYGSLAQQEAGAAAITGGTVQGLSLCESVNFQVLNRAGNDQLAFLGELNNVGTNRHNLYMSGNAPNYLAGNLGVGREPVMPLDVTGTARAQVFQVDNRAGNDQTAYAGALTNVGTNRFNLYMSGDALNYLAGPLGVQAQPVGDRALALQFAKATQHGVIIVPTGADASPGAALLLRNVAGTDVGSITTTAAATQFNTTSDARLKHGITPLAGALAVVQALRPVRYLWNVNDEPGEGFLAHELMRHVPAAVTGEPDAVGPQGEIVPQGVDHSRLVPWLTAALQEAVAQVQALAARVSSLEEQLGV